MEVFKPFLYDGYVSLPSEGSKAIPIRILRDTGASQSLIAANVLPFSDSTYPCTSVLIQGVDSPTCSSIPLHHVHLMSDLVTGPVSVGIKSSLPFDGVRLLLGNDLAGDKVKVNPLLTEKPCYDQILDSVEQEIPGLYPSCVVTRSMSKIPRNEVKQLSQDSTIVPNSGSTSDIISHSSDDTKSVQKTQVFVQIQLLVTLIWKTYSSNKLKNNPVSQLVNNLSLTFNTTTVTTHHNLSLNSTTTLKLTFCFKRQLMKKKPNIIVYVATLETVSSCASGDHLLPLQIKSGQLFIRLLYLKCINPRY